MPTIEYSPREIELERCHMALVHKLRLRAFHNADRDYARRWNDFGPEIMGPEWRHMVAARWIRMYRADLLE